MAGIACAATISIVARASPLSTSTSARATSTAKHRAARPGGRPAAKRRAAARGAVTKLAATPRADEGRVSLIAS